MTSRTTTAGLVATHVGWVVNRLQGGYLPSGSRTNRTSEAARWLAVLRRADASRPAADPRVWEMTLAEIPEELLSDGAEPSAAERAIHAALVTYAGHQQSRPTPMHVPGRSLGRAAGELARRGSTEGELSTAVLRRFQAVGTATGASQRLYHLRSLVSLLRREQIPLDYARLAADLYWLETGRGVDGVRMRWGRDLHRRPGATSEADGPTDHSTVSQVRTDHGFSANAETGQTQ